MELFEHQIEALKSMHNGCILCGGVGTGKSMTALAYYTTRVGNGVYRDGSYKLPTYIKRLIIITTPKKRDSHEWDRELERFDIFCEGESPGSCGLVPVVDSWNNIKKYDDLYGCFFIFDEQRVCGYGAWVKSFLRISRRNQWILLSATPGDVWMDYLPVFIANGFYKNKSDFMWRHVLLDPYVKYPRVRGYINEHILEKHREEVLVTMLYEKPAVSHHIDIFVPYDAEKYHTVWKTRWNPYTDKPFKQISDLCVGLRRITNEDPRRLEKVQEICEQRCRVVIFYNFNYELEMLRDMCKQMDVTYSEWNGHKHEKIPDTDKWIYLVQYTAGAEGWECVETNTVIFYSQSYSYKATIQASGRIDRLTTPFTDLYFYHITSKSPIDVAIGKTLNRKEEFNEKAFVEEEKDAEIRETRETGTAQAC